MRPISPADWDAVPQHDGRIEAYTDGTVVNPTWHEYSLSAAALWTRVPWDSDLLGEWSVPMGWVRAMPA